MSHCDNHRPSFYWHEDCLSLVLILSGCLSRKDLLRHGRKAGLWTAQPPDGPGRLLLDVHEACHADPELRKNVAKQISRRFPGLIRKVRAAGPGEIDELYQDTEWPLFLLWACLTDPRGEIRRQGRLLSHDLVRTAVKESFVDKGELPAHEDLELLRQGNRDLARENLSLKSKLDKVRAKLKKQRDQASLPMVQQAPVMGNLGQQREIRKLRYEVARLQKELAQGDEPQSRDKRCCLETDPVMADDTPLPRPDCPSCRKETPCRDCPLEGRRVAIIGGLDRMESVYRQVVEKLGGEFEFHCGRVKDGCQSVQGLVNRADYIFYITTINSHASMRATKTICKKNCKRFIALKERGAGTLERRLREVVQG